MEEREAQIVSGIIAAGIIAALKNLWFRKTRCNSWPSLSCIIRRFLCPKFVIKIHAYLYRLSENFFVSFCILFH